MLVIFIRIHYILPLRRPNISLSSRPPNDLFPLSSWFDFEEVRKALAFSRSFCEERDEKETAEGSVATNRHDKWLCDIEFVTLDIFGEGHAAVARGKDAADESKIRSNCVCLKD